MKKSGRYIDALGRIFWKLFGYVRSEDTKDLSNNISQVLQHYSSKLNRLFLDNYEDIYTNYRDLLSYEYEDFDYDFTSPYKSPRTKLREYNAEEVWDMLIDDIYEDFTDLGLDIDKFSFSNDLQVLYNPNKKLKKYEEG